MKKVVIECIVVLTSFALLYGCGGPQLKPYDYLANAPDWVTQGSGAFNGERGKVFYGVGVSNYIELVAKRNAADSAARAEVAKTIDQYVAVLEKEYLATTVSGQDRESMEKHFEKAMKTVTAMTLPGVEIVDHWQDSQGALYSLARLDLESLKSGTERMGELEELDKKLKDYIKENADRLHEELEREADKLGRK